MIFLDFPGFCSPRYTTTRIFAGFPGFCCPRYTTTLISRILPGRRASCNSREGGPGPGAPYRLLHFCAGISRSSRSPYRLLLFGPDSARARAQPSGRFFFMGRRDQVGTCARVFARQALGPRRFTWAQPPACAYPGIFRGVSWDV